MTMAHRASSSVVEHWFAVQGVPGSILGQSILRIVEVVWPNVTHNGVAGRILLLREHERAWLA